MVNAPQQVPRIGMFATVRNRHGVTTGVEPFDGPTGRLHLVHVEYKDDQAPRNEKLIGELEAETGGWLKGVASSLQAEIAGLDATVAGLRLNQATGDMTEVDPLADSRYAELEGLIERLLRAKGDWLDDERLVVFTEYQTTRACLRPQCYPIAGRAAACEGRPRGGRTAGARTCRSRATLCATRVRAIRHPLQRIPLAAGCAAPGRAGR